MSTDGTVRAPTDTELNRLLAELLGVQQHLATPVTRASAAYDARVRRSVPDNLQDSFHRDLLPFTAPGPGEQYAFEVDLDACSGCKACVAACHSLNGLDDTESWRDVGLLISTSGAPWQQTVTTACHHCAEPGCLEGCPVAAYEKDPLTGIVRHLDDQCIGCSYCILKCPYDVPKFNARLGIVRKCDMCHQRLAVGEAPACAQACPTQAIRIVTASFRHAESAVPSDAAEAPDTVEDSKKVGSSDVVRRVPVGFGRSTSRPPFAPPIAQIPPSPPANSAAASGSSSAHDCGCDHGGCGCKQSPSLRASAGGAGEPKSHRQEKSPSRPPPRAGTGFTPAIRPSSAASPVRPPRPDRIRHSDLTHFLPAAPDPSYTKPTTHYVSARGLPPHVRAADAGALHVQPAHWPLVVMLVLTQLAVGLASTAPLLPLPAPSAAPLADIPGAPAAAPHLIRAALDAVNHWLTSTGTLSLPELLTYYVTVPRDHAEQLCALALLFAGLGASVLHLGRPLRAWRFFLGLRTSWLSREILAFNLLVPLACATLLWPASLPLRLAVASASAGAVFSSAMIYIDTRRRFWRAPSTALRLFGNAIVAALALALPAAAALALGIKLLAEAAQTRGSGLTARLQRGPLRTTLLVRFVLGVAAVATFLAAPGWGAFALFAAGELAERILFFRSVDAPKMPGNPASA
ncbi:MAG TPA: DmsC/YnfH family molybdoenzyme membrane anchor subunit [Opitutaceae bacterium]|nr:DmsC/YnfH family molybdoenzyme membrane anchor subunit [Opitutaceae bacterium]